MALSSTQNLCSSVNVRCCHFVQKSRVRLVSDRAISPFFLKYRHASCLVLPSRCASFAAQKLMFLHEKDSSKRNSLYKFLCFCRQNGVGLSSTVGMSAQLSSLATDSSSCLSDVKGSEVTEGVPSSHLLCKDFDLGDRLDDCERDFISYSNAGKSESKFIITDAIGSKNMIMQMCKEGRFEWDTSSEEHLHGQTNLLKEDNSHIQENVKASISSSLSNSVFASFLWHGVFAMSALAAGDITHTESKAISESLEATSRAPTWLIPTILAFPVVTYLLFNVYRDKVNPYAKISDWLFGLVVLVIVGNIVMMVTLGVRLY